MTPLIDATEMYLRTVWELEEEGITPIRARLVERLGLSAPAVSETVTRLEAEGLMRMAADRTLGLTEKGREIAMSVMRKHRLAERLIVDVIGVEWELSHNEACRWEHVISDHVEQRIAELLGEPDRCPHGNPIPSPGDEERAADTVHPPARAGLSTLAEAARKVQRARIARISEMLQGDVPTMSDFVRHGIVPGARVELSSGPTGVTLRPLDGEAVEALALAPDAAELVYVERLD
ncbi:metal-dependent transcriptional regulator [Egibacter rhizosphaerae]|uniref:metal-dependent transcriptional regulator n=1 Tax=Egibacter rhizosphaerae TaxID=1670831 RepID=UPI001F0CE9D1|nr:metal-dependent transcriptional regulator [Egibacter rhizosphaerae]